MKDKKTNSKRLSKVLKLSNCIDSFFAIGLGVIGLSIGALLWWVQWDFAFTTTNQKYGKFDTYTDKCGIATVAQDLAPTDLEASRLDLNFTPTLVPMRFEGAPIVRVPKGHFMVIKCNVDFSTLQDKAEPWFTAGLITGDSTVFINQEAVFYGGPSSYVTGFLRKTDLKKNAEIKIVVRRAGNESMIGLTGTVPLIYGSGIDALRKVEHYWQVYSIDNALYRLGITTTFLFIFFSIWMRGIRYRDVEWMMMSMGALSLFPLTQLLTHMNVEWFIPNQFTFIYFLEAATLGGFAIAFTRSDRVMSWYRCAAALFVIAGVPAYVLLNQMLQFKPLTNFNISIFWLCISFLAAAAISIKRSRSLSPVRRRRLILVAAACLIGCGCYLVQIYYLFSKVILLAPFVNFTLMAMFAVFLMTDLVVTQHQLRAEKNSKEQREYELSEVAKKLVNARSVQHEMLPKQHLVRTDCFDLRFLFEAHDAVAGDWAVIEEFNGGYILLLGDITGKGPAAGLAMASVIGIAKSSIERASIADEIVMSIDKGIWELFNGKVGSTLSAILIDENRNYFIASWGTPPPFHLSQKGASGIKLSGGFLGIGSVLNIDWKPVDADDGDFIVCLSDGYIGSSRDFSKFARELVRIDRNCDVEQFFVSIDAFFKANKINYEDDKSGIVLKVKKVA